MKRYFLAEDKWEKMKEDQLGNYCLYEEVQKEIEFLNVQMRNYRIERDGLALDNACLKGSLEEKNQEIAKLKEQLEADKKNFDICAMNHARMQERLDEQRQMAKVLDEPTNWTVAGNLIVDQKGETVAMVYKSQYAHLIAHAPMFYMVVKGVIGKLQPIISAVGHCF